MDVKIPINHPAITGSVKPIKADNTEAKVEKDSIDYSSSNPDVIEVVEDPADETKFTINLKGVGEADFQASGDADLGEGVKTVTTKVHFTVTEEEATGFQVNFDNLKTQ